MRSEKELCVVCAWRETCQKKFSLPAGRSCPEFSKDLSLRPDESEDSAENVSKPEKINEK